MRMRSQPTEWADATYVTEHVMIAEPGEVTDDCGNTNDEVILVLDNGSHNYVIEGTCNQLLDLARKIEELAIIHRNNHGR